MEKISHIVRGNARVSSADVKSSSAVRPGAPSFGRDVGQSTAPNDPPGTTASRAVSLQSQMAEQRRAAGDKEKVVEQMADAFFMSRIRRPDDADVRAQELLSKHNEALNRAKEARAQAAEEGAQSEMEFGGGEVGEQAQPQGYHPRGSYVDVQA